MAALVVEIPATNQPVTLTMAKNFCRVSITDDDALFNVLIAAATGACETFTNRSFCFKGFRQSLDSFPYFTDSALSQQAYPPSYYALPRYSTTLWNYSQMIKLLRPPLVKVTRISYISSSDEQWHDLVPAPSLWYPGTVYALAAKVMDNNQNVQQCSTAGTSNSNPPTWNATVGGTTVEGTDSQGEGTGVQWLNLGPLAAPDADEGAPSAKQSSFGTFIWDSDSEPGRLFPGPPGNMWPPCLYVPNAVQIHYQAGYSADGSLVPAEIQTAILQMVANLYENREASTPLNLREVPNHVKMLLWSKRVTDFAGTRG
jgi:hypothetical protein